MATLFLLSGKENLLVCSLYSDISWLVLPFIHSFTSFIHSTYGYWASLCMRPSSRGWGYADNDRKGPCPRCAHILVTETGSRLLFYSSLDVCFSDGCGWPSVLRAKADPGWVCGDLPYISGQEVSVFPCLAQRTRLEKMNLTNLPLLSLPPPYKPGTPKSKAIKIIMQIIHIFHLKSTSGTSN